MKIAKIVLVGAAAFAVLGPAFVPLALAQEAHTGTITQVNRLNNTVAIRRTQSGTVGANTGGAAEEFKVGNGISLETLHAGDAVNYSVNENSGNKTITKLDRR
jgi:hypothetical protein